ncbi:hypothetical protein [Priestia abyssalis]|uniref:hypothetical protein n=1 Tax=Priestia abyssalis TaxID=1221450 RepID=UPI0009952C3E|nr:hypothetical protein [Priestia abyssalis]
MPVSVVFNQINVINISVNSIIASGQNSQPDWSTQGKVNAGNGFYLNSAVLGCTNVINDQDLCDTPVSNPQGINSQPVSQV